MQLCKPDPICRDPDLPIPVTPIPDVVVILDDAVARRVAEALGLPLIGTLGIILEAKCKGLIPAVAPFLEQLQASSFRLAPHTQAAVLKLAKETSYG